MLVCEDHNVREQLAKLHTALISVQRRENADLQDSGLLDDHGGGVALGTSQLSVMTSSDRNRSSGLGHALCICRGRMQAVAVHR
jgi:hypothetical protein